MALWLTWSRNTEDTKTERSPTPKLGNQWHGNGEHLRAEHLRTRQEEEEPWTHGSDRPVLWRRQEETEQGEQQHLLWVSGCRSPSGSWRPGSWRPGSWRSGSWRTGSKILIVFIIITSMLLHPFLFISRFCFWELKRRWFMVGVVLKDSQSFNQVERTRVSGRSHGV